MVLLAALRVWYWWYVTPQTLNPDEAALLLNARFLVQSGVDEWNQSWPFVFRSFGDAKLPGYIYLIALTGWIGEYAWWTARLPSVVAGIILPFLVGGFVQQLSGRRWAGWLAAIALVMSPWSWHYGTTGFEANVGVTLFMAALVCWFRQRTAWWSDLLGVGLYALSVATYNAPMLLYPVVLLSGVVWRWPAKDDSQSIASFGRFVIGITAVFVGIMVITLPVTLQKSSITLWSDPTVINDYPQYRTQFSGLAQTVFGNQWAYFVRLMVENWIDSWSWSFLVTRGGQNPWHSIPLVGHVHPFVPLFALWSFPLLLAQWYRRGTWRSAFVLSALLFGATAPAVITVDAPHATRSLFFLVMLCVFAGLGMDWWFTWLWQRVYWSVRLSAVAATLGLLLIGWLWWFFPAQPRWHAMVNPKWRMNMLQTLANPRVEQAPHVLILDPDGVMYTYAALHENVSADTYTATVQRSAPDTVGMVKVESFGKYRFVSGRLSLEEQSLQPPGTVWIEQRSNTTWDIIEL